MSDHSSVHSDHSASQKQSNSVEKANTSDVQAKGFDADTEQLIQLFQEYCSIEGTITGDDALDILEDLKIPTTRAQIQAAVPTWKSIDQDAFLDLVDQIRGGADRTVNNHQLMNTITVHALPLLAFVRYKLNPFAKAPAGIEYTLQRIDFSVSPRTLLISMTAITLFFVSAAIIVMLFSLWTGYAASVDRRFIDNFNKMSGIFVENFDKSSLNRHGAEMSDGTETIAAMIQQEFAKRANVSLEAALQSQAKLTSFNWHNNLDIAKEASSIKTVGYQRVIARVATVDSSLWPLSSLYVDGAVQVKNKSGVIFDNQNGFNCSESATTSWLTLNATHETNTHVFEGTTFCNMKAIEAQSSVEQQWLSSWYAALPAAMDNVAVRISESWMWGGNNTVSQTLRHCLMALDDPNCAEMNLLMSMFDRDATHSFIRVGWDVFRVAAAGSGQTTLFMISPLETMLAAERDSIVQIANFMNFQFARSTELVVAPSRTNVQATKFRFADGCYGDRCQRRPSSASNVEKGFQTRGSGFGITPDYRPEPVMGAYSFIGGNLNMVYLIERDVVEINNITLTALIDTFDTLNRVFEGSLESQLVRFSTHPPAMLFDPFEDCSHVDDCYSVEGFGVVFRSDCPHCVRATSSNTTPPLTYLTKLRFDPLCSVEVDPRCLDTVDEVSRRSLSEDNSNSLFKGRDYRGVEVMSSTTLVSNLSIGVVVKVDVSESNAPIYRVVMIAVFISIAILLLGLTTLLVLSRRSIVKIEHNWAHFRKQTDEEKAAYSNLVKAAVPSFLAWRLMRGQSHVADVQQLFICFVDIPDFMDRAAQWAPEQLARFVSYYQSILLSTADHYKVHRARSLGDTAFFVAGFNVNDAGEAISVNHESIGKNVLKFASTLIQLCDPCFAHYPQRLPHLQRTFGTAAGKKLPDVAGRVENVGTLVMPQLRVAVHFGPTSIVLIKKNKYYDVDFLGSSVAIVAKLIQMTKIGCISASADAHDHVKQSNNEIFVFSEKRKMVMRGRGTIVYFHIKTANVLVPQVLFDEFGIRRARRRITYGLKRDDGIDDAASESMMSTATYEAGE